MSKPIFPEIIIDQTDEFLSFETHVRKQGEDGKWYLSKHYKRIDGQCVFEGYLNIFLFEVYLYLVNGIPSPHIVNPSDNSSVFILDDDQRSEKERLDSFLNL